LLELGKLDVLVQLVDAGVDRPELDDLRADVDDEAPSEVPPAVESSGVRPYARAPRA
jgi:hypothetical protein